MEAAISTPKSTGLTELAERFQEESVGKFMQVCDAALTWHRAHFVYRDPTEQERKEMKDVLKWLLLLGKLNHTALSDPDSGNKRLAGKMEIRITQLQDAYDYSFNALPEAEAESFLKEIFPDEQGA